MTDKQERTVLSNEQILCKIQSEIISVLADRGIRTTVAQPESGSDVSETPDIVEQILNLQNSNIAGAEDIAGRLSGILHRLS